MNIIDYCIFIFFLVLPGIFSLFAKSQQNDPLNYLVMGRQLTLPMFVMSLVTTWYGGVLGFTELAFNHGLFAFLTQGLFWYGSYLAFAFFLSKKIHQSSATTLPEYLGHIYGKKAHTFSAVVSLLNIIPLAYCLSFGLLLQHLWGGDLLYNTLFGTILVTLYSSKSGLKSVVYSESVQFFLMYAGLACIIIYSWQRYGGIDFLYSSLPKNFFNLTGNLGFKEALPWLVISFTTLIDPHFYHRCFAGRDARTVKNGLLISTFFWFIFDIGLTLGGLYARATHPEIRSHDSFLFFGLNVLPHGLKGFFMAGIAATILSTVESCLFLSGATFLQTFFPASQNIWMQRTVSLIFAILCSIIAVWTMAPATDWWLWLGSLNATTLLLPTLLSFTPWAKKFSPFFIPHFICVISVMLYTWWRSEHFLLVGLAASFTLYLLASLYLVMMERLFYPRN